MLVNTDLQGHCGEVSRFEHCSASQSTFPSVVRRVDAVVFDFDVDDGVVC